MRVDSMIPMLSSQGRTTSMPDLCGLSMHADWGLLSAKSRLKKVKGVCRAKRQQ